PAVVSWVRVSGTRTGLRAGAQTAPLPSTRATSQPASGRPTRCQPQHRRTEELPDTGARASESRTRKPSISVEQVLRDRGYPREAGAVLLDVDDRTVLIQ